MPKHIRPSRGLQIEQTKNPLCACQATPHDSVETLPPAQAPTASVKFEAHLYFLAESRSAGNTYEDTVWSAVESSIYQLFLFLSTAWKFLQFGGRTRQGIVGAADLRQCTCKIGEQKTFQTLRTWPGADSIGGRLCHWQTKQSKLHKSHKKQGKAVTCQ